MSKELESNSSILTGVVKGFLVGTNRALTLQQPRPDTHPHLNIPALHVITVDPRVLDYYITIPDFVEMEKHCCCCLTRLPLFH